MGFCGSLMSLEGEDNDGSARRQMRADARQPIRNAGKRPRCKEHQSPLIAEDKHTQEIGVEIQVVVCNCLAGISGDEQRKRGMASLEA